MNESVTLYFREGSSDKVYQAQLERAGKLFAVRFQYGRRGSAMASGTKTPAPVPYEDAKKIYDALVKSKTAKGYTPAESGVPYQAPPTGKPADVCGCGAPDCVTDMSDQAKDARTADTAAEKVPSEMRVQVLSPISEAEAERRINDGAFVAQEKYDGERRPVAHRANGVLGGNKLGVAVALPLALADAIKRLAVDSEIDGEQIGEQLYAFDMMRDAGQDLRKLPYIERYLRLTAALNRVNNPTFGRLSLVLAPLAIGTKAKRELYERCKTKEGVVFKRAASIYKPGTGKNLDQVKFKFVESATLEVASVHPTKRSVSVQAYDGKKPVPLGSVTVHGNQDMPAVGDIVEVRYLYCVDALFQSVYLGKRPDQTRASCTIAQIKYKETA